MKDIIILIVGWLLGVATSWFFSKKSSSELEGTESRIVSSLEENIRQLTTQLSASTKLTQYSLTQLKEAGLLEKAKELELEAQNDIATSKEIIESIPSNVIEGIDTKIFDNTRSCPQCGKPSFPAGFGPDQGGSMVFYYHCPEHGRFPSNHIDDMMDD
jgi:hypothetical protein